LKLVNFTHFYVEPRNVHEQYFILTEDEARHASRVLRLHEGDELSAVDGMGNLFIGKISSIEKRQLVAHIEHIEHNVGEAQTHLTIVQGVPKGNRFDIVIEKGTEIGVAAFQPFITKRSILKPDTRIERWQQKAIAAMKQCGRSRCPEIHVPVEFESFLNDFDGQMFIAHEDVETTRSAIETFENIALLIGPEGGFTEDEFELAVDKGAVPIHLGPRRLRSETAALVGAVKLLHLADELN